MDDGWRVGHQGRDSMFYEELVDGEWRRLDLAGEMGTGRAHHVIYLGSKAAWQQRPEWARSRRSEILARIKSAFPIPDYEYEGEELFDENDRTQLIAAAGGLSTSVHERVASPPRARNRVGAPCGPRRTSRFLEPRCWSGRLAPN